MIKLIKNEFKKLFSKKLMYVLFIIIIFTVILSNVLYSIEIVNSDSKDYLEEHLSYIKEEMNRDEYKKEENKEELINLKTQYEIIKLELNYDIDSWQYYILDRDEEVYWVIRDMKSSELNNDSIALEKTKKEYDKIKQKLDSGDWKSFIEFQLKNIDEKIENIQKRQAEVKDLKTIQELDIELENLEIDKQALEWRIEKNIPPDNSFLSGKIENYRNSLQFISGMKYQENKSKEEKLNYNESLKNANICRYYIENNIIIEKEYNAGYNFANIINEYGIFIIIFSIIVAGTIVSNESQKGTIKLLLTRPYSRCKILLSKYIVSIASIFIFVICFMIIQFIVGGIVDGFDIFKVPMVEYNLEKNKIIVMNTFNYSIIKTLSAFPVIILLSTLGFSFSTITSNSAISIAMPILGYMGSNVINYFMERVKILKYFVTANWDLSVYLFGGKGLEEGLNFTISLIICLIYFTIMIITTFVVFNKRDIKNV